MSSTNPHPAHDDHAPMGRPSEETIRRGYEKDTYDAKSVLSVPLIVILFFVLAFGTVTVIFRFIAYPKSDPRAHPAAAERNKRPLNDRIAGIGKDDPFYQPRPEPLELRKGGDMARAISQVRTEEGNSPEIHPEELRVTKERFPTLYQSGNGRYSIDKVMDLSDAGLKELFPSKGKPLSGDASQHVPTAANAGRGASVSMVIPLPPPPAIGAPKKPDEKKPDEKKPEEKKPEQKKQAEPPKAPEPPKK
jgi:hypothetical protein